MSKLYLSFSLAAIVVLLAGAASVVGQNMEATVIFDLKNPALVTVEGHFVGSSGSSNQRNVSFPRSAAGIQGLADRVSELRLFDGAGKAVDFKKVSEGEYLSDSSFERWTYVIDLHPLKNRSAAAHASWFASGTGVLMTADLLPHFVNDAQKAVRLSIKGPTTLDINSRFVRTSETQSGDVFDVYDSENAVFYVGHGWESGYSLGRRNPIDVLISGTWNFGPDDASNMATEIYAFYERRYGRPAGPRPIIGLAKFPVPTEAGQWEAETRGRYVTIISSDTPFKSQSLQRLHEQLRHELFHLWIPNGVGLTGKYDWFYEGFALYQSLKLAVEFNRIRFDDFLDTLSRAHTIDSSQSQRTSLIQASTNRFGGSNTQVYARGMLIAFLTDLTMLERSKRRHSVEDLLTDLYAKHRKPAKPTEGNTAVIEELKVRGVTSIVERYITGTEKIDWTTELSSAGIEDSDPGPVTTLRVKDNLKGGEKAMLDKLGYNNWRKLSPRSK